MMKSREHMSDLVRINSKRKSISGKPNQGEPLKSNQANSNEEGDGNWRISFKALGQLDSKEAKKRILTADNQHNFYGTTNSISRVNDNNTTTNIWQPNDNHGKRNPYAVNVPDDDENFSVADIIGSFGWFQFIVLLFSGLREASVGYDALITSIILQPESNFLCADNLEPGFQLPSANRSVAFILPTKPSNETAQCFRHEAGKVLIDSSSGQAVRCKAWLFPESVQGASLVADWSLVCDRHWMVAFIESAYFFGLVTGNLVWGYYADQIGRKRAYLIAHTVALVAGWGSIFMPQLALFALCRFFSAFGSIGYNIIYSIQVELIGTKHRAFSTTLNHLGWGLGVICVPLMSHLFSNYRYMIMVSPLITLIMFPLAFWLPESSRWLMADGQSEKACYELIRAAKFNGKQVSASLEKKIAKLDQRIRNDKLKQDANTDKKSYQLLFKSPILLRDTLILAYISFVGHLFYYTLTINFSYMKNLSVDANFIISGAGEWVSVVVGAVLLRFCSRKSCLALFLSIMAASFAFQSTIDMNFTSSLENPIVVTTNNAIGTLSSLLLIFVALIVNQEVYPTIIRQTGSSVVNTFGESGSTVAPMLMQLARLIGLWRADLVYAVICALGVVGVQFLTKTDDIELPDA